MGFQVNTTYTFDNMVRYQKLNGRTVRRSECSSMRKTYTFVGVVGLFLALMMWATDGGLLILICGLIGLACILLVIFFYPWMARSAWKTLPEDKSCAFTFREDCFSFATSVQTGDIGYSDLYGLYETQTCFFLYMNEQAAFILPKADFTQGEPDKLGAFWKEKTGKDVNFIKMN